METANDETTYQQTNLPDTLAADLMKSFSGARDQSSAVKFYKLWLMYSEVYPESYFVGSFNLALDKLDKKFGIFSAVAKTEEA